MVVLAAEGAGVPPIEAGIPSSADVAMLVSADIPKLPREGGGTLLEVDTTTSVGRDDEGLVPPLSCPGYTV